MFFASKLMRRVHIRADSAPSACLSKRDITNTKPANSRPFILTVKVEERILADLSADPRRKRGRLCSQ